MVRRKRKRKHRPRLDDEIEVDELDELFIDDYYVEPVYRDMCREAIKRAKKRSTDYIV